MIDKNKLLRLRKVIEQAAVSLPDETALTAVELFPSWAVETEYHIGERIRYEDKLYRVVQTHTSQASWEPPNVPALFTEVAKPGEIPVWVQPTGIQDAYMIGDKVIYNSIIYESLVDNNVWSPELYPAGWRIIE